MKPAGAPPRRGAPHLLRLLGYRAMHFRRRATIAVLTASLAVVPAASAAFAESFKGATNQRRAVSVVTGTDGTPTRIRVPWVAHCKHGRYSAATTFRAPFDESDAQHVRDSGPYSGVPGRGFKSTITVALSATHLLDPRIPDAESWSGVLDVTVVVRKRGKTVDRCRAKTVGFRTTLAR